MGLRLTDHAQALTRLGGITPWIPLDYPITYPLTSSSFIRSYPRKYFFLFIAFCPIMYCIVAPLSFLSPYLSRYRSPYYATLCL